MNSNTPWVLGLGSPHGDDGVGWAVAQRLDQAGCGCSAKAISDPLAILEVPIDSPVLILIDACRGVGQPGSIHRFQWPDASLAVEKGVSSHGIGLVEAFKLAETLGKLPPRVIVLVVEAGTGEPASPMSPAVKAAIPVVIDLVLAELRMSGPVAPDVLKSLAFLAPATDEELLQLATVSHLAVHPAGSVLFREGDHVSHICVVASGQVAIEIYGPERRQRRIHTVGTGELLGWSPILGSGAMTASARTLTESRIITIDAKSILAICDADPRFGYLFMRRVAHALAARLNATRFHLLDVFGTEIPSVS